MFAVVLLAAAMSFDPAQIAYLRRIAPELPRGMTADLLQRKTFDMADFADDTR